ncbi:hypothetical protein G7085_15280 [Tessaracoccus sp. HDW20]|uniref:hypothetical protein n=1 Tax=Tessaracoccus coleopterorum TaxID=2714950 RepID=UPI0018D41BFE|nr:hypothetical protein [Tessaracoccus coleopterorum]NHB85511.1 hypothetical protein [Tessaracoccus coleopterorum]
MLRKGECTLGGAVDLIEHHWLWLGVPRTDCPGVLGGSSGSPLIADGTVVSIINTTNGGVPADRAGTCYLGKPCEITDAGAMPSPRRATGSMSPGSAPASPAAASPWAAPARCPPRASQGSVVAGSSPPRASRRPVASRS